MAATQKVTVVQTGSAMNIARQPSSTVTSKNTDGKSTNTSTITTGGYQYKNTLSENGVKLGRPRGAKNKAKK